MISSDADFFFPLVERLERTFGVLGPSASVQGLQMVIWELTTHNLHAQQGLPQQGLFFTQPYAGIQQAQMMVQDSWLFRPLMFPAQIQFSIKKP